MTFREKPITKLYAFALAAVFALTLAGCGGGGGSATAPDPEPPTMPEPTPQEMCEGDGGRYNADGSCTSAEELAAEMAEAEALSGAQSAAMAAYMAAMAAVSGAKDPVAMGNAQPHAAMAKEASDMAAEATASEMAMEYQMKAEMYRDMAMKAAMDRGLGVTMLANKQLNGEDIANAELEETKPPAYRSNASNVGAAMAAAAGATSTDTAGMLNLSDSSDATVATPATVNVAAAGTAVADHKAGGSTFTLELGTGNAFLEGETPSRFQTKGGWEAQDLVLAGTNAKTHLVVNTDIQADTQNYNATADIAVAGITANGGVIVAGEVAGDGSNFAATFNENPADNNPPVAGQFRCSTAPATACSISVDASGKVVANTGYEFHESDGTTRADSDYLAWGFWVTGSTLDSLSGTTPPNTAPHAQAGAFAYGSDLFVVSPELKGTATYNGDASGLYSAGGMVEYFDADVSLTANFGGTVGADNSSADAANDGLLIGAVTGSITNIRAGGMDVAGSLTLEKATVTRTDTGNPAGAFLTSGALTLDPASGSNSVAGFTDDVSGTLAGRAMDGTWRGQFYGPNRARTAKAAETEYPTTAAGTFAAEAPGHSGDPVRIMGSFGTWKAE